MRKKYAKTLAIRAHGDDDAEDSSLNQALVVSARSSSSDGSVVCALRLYFICFINKQIVCKALVTLLWDLTIINMDLW